MAYTKTTWRNNQSPAINADNLNHIEQGVYEAHQDIAENTQNIENLTTQTGANTSAIALEKTQRQQADTAETLARENADNLLSARMDTFTQLPSGSTSGDAELIDIRVGADGVTYPTAGDAVRGQVTDLKSELSDIATKYLLNGAKDLVNEGYYGEDGTIYANSSFRYSTVYIDVKPSTSYSFWRQGNTWYAELSSGGVVWYDSNKSCLGRAANQSVVTSPSNARYARLYANKDYVSGAMFIEGTTRPTVFIPFGYDIVTAYEDKLEVKYKEGFANSVNYKNNISIDGFNKQYTEEDVSKTAHDDYVVTTSGYIGPSELWRYYTADVEGNATYYYKGHGASAAYALMIYDKENRRIATYPMSASDGSFSGYIVMPINATHIVLNTLKSETAELKRVTGLKYIGAAGDASYFYGKKLYCGGDSITEGANVGTFPNGYKKTYGGFVATRNGMDYASDGVGGSTIARCTINGALTNNFITSRYQNIPTDADYITLWFGWNDNAYGWKSKRDEYCVSTYGTYYSALTEAQKAEVDVYQNWRYWLTQYVGTINSEDNTTWSGAWNIVLTWLLTNCPDSHIGVVLAYGTDAELNNMLIQLCEKYGVSYVKAYDPSEFFSVGHSNGIGSVQATRRKELYTLDNTHPNELGYEMMSASYEQFLRKI